ncbi:MAG: hypothetical protein ABJF01_13780 [bacterium]
MRLILRTAALITALATMALPAGGQQQQRADGYNWSGKIPAGRWIRIRNLNGPITVGAASGDNVEVIATKQWRRGDPSVVRFEMKKFGPGEESVIICALWGDRSSCDEHNYDTHTDRNDRRMRNNDVSVTFRVLVPKGVKVGVTTVNGAVVVDGATAEVEAGTINGELEVATSGGPVNATNVNGGVRARLGRLDSDANMEFTTVNGSVVVEFGGEFGADVDLQTVNGSLNTNFEMTVSGRLDPKHLRAHIGKPGGPRIRLETVNGSVELRHR